MQRFLVLMALLVAMPGLVHADLCDDINVIANGWNDVANLVDEYGTDEPLTHDEERELSALVSALREGSEALVYLLQEEGDGREQRMGNRIADGLDGIYDADYDDELVGSMDDVVDALDDLVDYCDSY